MQKDSFSKRYIVKLSSSILIVMLSAICQLLLPRALSIEEYGYYSYNLNIFTSIVLMTNLSMSDAMVSKLAKRNNDIGYIKYYLIFFSIIAILLNLVVVLIGSSDMALSAFGNQTFLVILLGLNVYIVNKLFTDVISMYDAMAFSKFPALMNVLLKIIMSICITAGYFLRILNLSFFYVFQICITSIIVMIMVRLLLKEQYTETCNINKHDLKRYLKEYYIFCRPLVMATIISKLVMILMTWSLMKWSGVVAQAMFGAAWQINTLISYIYSPFAELLKREFAVEVNNRTQLQYRFRQSLQSVIWPVAYLAIFTMIFADWILPIIYGNKYNDAIIVTRIMMIYTVYVAWGQVNGALYIASERTKQYSIFGITGQLLTLLCVFIFQIPNIIWPDGLGALGLALNYLLVNLIMVTVQTSCNSIYVQSNPLKDNFLLIPPLIFCTVFACVARGIICLFSISTTPGGIIIQTIAAGIIYSLFLVALIYYNPRFIGITREQLRQLIKKMILKTKIFS